MFLSHAQVDSIRMLESKPGLSLAGYGEVHYNQPMDKNTYNQGSLDVHRMVMFLGYNFSSKTKFITEIEFEHAHEVDLEQMFLQHRINQFIDLRLGLILIPMGIINEHHEPTLFNGVERPVIDNKICPTTWREIGGGITGNIMQASLKYQLYVVNGLNGYDANGGVFSGSEALRAGRQSGAESYSFSPSLAGRIEFYGIRNLRAGISIYSGKSQSYAYKGLNKDSVELRRRADSSVVSISMIGGDVRYVFEGIQLRGQVYYTMLGNTKQYNMFTAKDGKYNDLGSAMIGYYGEIGYNVFRPLSSMKSELIPFVRYEVYDTHYAVPDIISQNKGYHNTIITTGVTYSLTKGSVLKADVQLMKSKLDNSYHKILNLGFGIMF